MTDEPIYLAEPPPEPERTYTQREFDAGTAAARRGAERRFKDRIAELEAEIERLNAELEACKPPTEATPSEWAQWFARWTETKESHDA